MKNSTKNSAILITSFLLLFTVFFSTKAQAQMTDEEYAVINAIYYHRNLYHTTLFNKGWAHYFEDIDNIVVDGYTGFPTWVTDKELRKKLDDEILNDIYSEIKDLKPVRLSQKKLEPDIHLMRHFDTKKALKKGVIRISKPIIIDGRIAVIKQEGIHISNIYIIEKKEGKWKIIYTFYDWLIIID